MSDRDREPEEDESDQPRSIVPPPVPFPVESAIAEANADPTLAADDNNLLGDDWTTAPIGGRALLVPDPDPAAVPDPAASTDPNASLIADRPETSTAPARAPTHGSEPEPDQWVQELAALPNRWMRILCLHLAQHGVLSLAANSAKVSLATVRKHERSVPEFGRMLGDARERAADLIEANAVQLATVGVPEPVFQGGFLVGYRRKKDVRAMELLLKARKPEAFAVETVQHKHTGKVEICPPEQIPERVRRTQQLLFEQAKRIGANFSAPPPPK